MTETVLLMGPLMETVMEELEHHYTVHRYYEAEDPQALVASLADTLRAVVTDGGTGISEAVLSQLPNVEIVTVFGVGVDAVALDYCKSNHIKVTNTPDVLSDDVADLGVALMLAVSRQMITGDDHARSGKWAAQGAMPLTTRMTGKRAGIFGMGSIGLRLANRLTAFDMDVSYCNRNKRSDTAYRYYSDIIDMAREVDYLVVAASASAATQHIINADVFSALGSEGYLINVSRGSLVDEPALIHALENGVIKGAGLDVFADEPNVPEPLCAMSQVVLQPHHASGTVETRQAMGRVVTDNLEAFFAGTKLLTEYYL